VAKSVTDPSVQIPDGLTHPESRSVLKNKTAGGSPRALAVLPVCGSDGRKAASVVSNTGKPVDSKQTVTWAEIVSR
jgi:hypothetical protein